MSTAVVVTFASFRKIKEKTRGVDSGSSDTLIPLPTRAGRRWKIVWLGPRLGFVAETARFVAMETP